LLKWKEDLSIGVLEIDIQHKLLFEKFNAFLAACESQTEDDAIYRLFWFLEAYAVTHFTNEEKLMQQVAYPDFAVHREQHLAFTSQVSTLKERLRSEGPNPALISHMRMFISTWLIEHISRMDSAIGAFISPAGARALP
jgi:hemerythrin